MPTLVIGATGKTGRSVVEQLVDKGESVRAASRHPAPATDSVEPATFDWGKTDTWAAALAGAEHAYVVGPVGEADPAAVISEFVEQAEAAGMQHLVLLSAFGVEHAPAEVPMRAAELAVLGSGMDSTILRPNWFHQNFDESFFLPPIQSKGELWAPTGDGSVSFVDTRDIAAVGVAALTEPGHAGKAYGITGPESLTFAEVAEIFAAAIGKPVRHVDAQPEQMKELIVTEGYPPPYADLLLGLFANLKQGFGAAVTPDVEQVLGRPGITVAAYAAEVADTLRG